MSCSKPLQPFVCDSLYYLNRNQLERFSIVCRPLKNFIDRYLHTKPYRVFDQLWIHGGSYALLHNNCVRWHPNRDDYSAQQFLAGEELHLVKSYTKYYSFAEMRPYLDQTVRIESIWIRLDRGFTYNSEHIEQIESIAHLWCNRKIFISKEGGIIVAEDFQLILDSTTILQCRYLVMENAHFSFKDYKILYNPKIIVNDYGDPIITESATDPDYWPQFLEQPGVKPMVVLRVRKYHSIYDLVDRLSKAFSSAVSPNAFKLVFVNNWNHFPEFRKTNETSGEKLELKEGFLTEYQNDYSDRNYKEKYPHYILERSII
ncbi:hypothetical protein Ddc_12404 [Ditylenchus destructor]|nr:hypothetical protein Ddc_12404 [Ditylenchus destructor]